MERTTFLCFERYLQKSEYVTHEKYIVVSSFRTTNKTCVIYASFCFTRRLFASYSCLVLLLVG